MWRQAQNHQHHYDKKCLPLPWKESCFLGPTPFFSKAHVNPFGDVCIRSRHIFPCRMIFMAAQPFLLSAASEALFLSLPIAWTENLRSLYDMRGFYYHFLTITCPSISLPQTCIHLSWRIELSAKLFMLIHTSLSFPLSCTSLFYFYVYILLLSPSTNLPAPLPAEAFFCTFHRPPSRRPLVADEQRSALHKGRAHGDSARAVASVLSPAPPAWLLVACLVGARPSC